MKLKIKKIGILRCKPKFPTPYQFKQTIAPQHEIKTVTPEITKSLPQPTSYEKGKSITPEMQKIYFPLPQYTFLTWVEVIVGWKFIAEKVAPAGTTEVIFDGLDGDTDKQYMLIGDGYMTLDGVDRHIYLAPNGIETDQHNMEIQADWPGNTSGPRAARNYPDSRISLARNGWGLNGDYTFRALMHAKTGLRRHIISLFHWWRADREAGGLRTSIWDDTATNITSLAIRISGGSFSGTFRLFKMIES